MSRFNGWTWQTTETDSGTTPIQLSFAWFGSNTNSTGTWDYAPLDEFSETEPERFNKWQDRMERDPQYRRQQIEMNRRQNIWHDNAVTNGTTRDSIMCYTYSTTGANNEHWILTSDFDRFYETRPWYQKYKPFRKLLELPVKLNKFFKFNRTAEEIQQERAEKKSWKLVKEWLTLEEFAELTSKGEMEIQSKEDLETIYIIKKDPLATVQEVKKGKNVKSMCIIPKEQNLPSGDALLSKIMLLKTDERQFKEIAINRNLA